MLFHIDSFDDPRIAAYRNLKDRELARMGSRFIAEGEQVVRRLLESSYPTESVLLSQKREAEISPVVPGQVPVYVVPNELMAHVVGFKFHSGVMACGVRKPAVSVADALGGFGRRAMVVICPQIANTENLGSLMRIAAGFGADAMLLGPQSCDPFYRQAIRVSMGAVFSLKLLQSNDLLADMTHLRTQGGFELIASVLDESAEPLPRARRSDRIAMLFGNEAQGLAPEIVAACDRCVTIPMKLGTDSLNVAIAAAVIMYAMGEMREER